MGCGNSTVGYKTKWDILEERVPYQRTNEKLKIREVLYSKFDRSYSKSLTLEDCLFGCQKELHLDELFPEHLERANIAAFFSSHRLRTKPDNTDGVDPAEFRLYLVYLRDSINYSYTFNKFDKSGESKLTHEEFVNAAPEFDEYGLPISDPYNVFNEIGKVNRDKVTYLEFCNWASKQELDNDKNKKLMAKRKANQERQRGRMERIAAIKEAIPTGYSPEQRKRRETLFHKYDRNGIKQLSMDDCLNGSKKHLRLDKYMVNKNELEELNNGAFRTAKCAAANPNSHPDYLDKNEFNMYLIALRDHCELNEMFNDIHKGQGANARRINKEQFVEVTPQLREWGVPDYDPDVTFQDMDNNYYGTVHFVQLAQWACKRNMDIEKAHQATRASFEALNAQQNAEYDGIERQEDDEICALYEEHQCIIALHNRQLWARVQRQRELEDVARAQEDAARAHEYAAARAQEAASMANRQRQIIEEAQEHTQPIKTRNPVDVARRHALWDTIRRKFPLERTKAEGKKRDIMFDLFDRTKTETLDESECFAGSRDILDLDQLTNNLVGVNRMAYKSASSFDSSSDTIDRVGFRLYLVYLREYFELHNMFDDVDASEDDKISRSQFTKAVPKLEEWGLKSPEKTFDMIDKDKCGTIDFIDFAKNVIEPRLEMEKEDIHKKEAARKAAEADMARGEATEKEKEAAKVEAERRRVMWEIVKLRLPRLKTEEQNEQRNQLFKKFDVSNKGVITFKECCEGCYTILKLKEFYDNIEPIVLRSFNHAANAQGAEGRSDVLERIEFRIFLVFIFDYLELFVKFEEMDFAVDRLIGFNIFEKCVPVFESWGIKIPDPVSAFDEIDVLDVGLVDFDTFADWGVAQHMKAQNVKVVINKTIIKH